MFVDETKIYYIDGIPVAFPYIVEWWEEYSNKVPFRQRKFRDPHYSEKDCLAIANQIVKEMRDKMGDKKFGYTYDGGYSDNNPKKTNTTSVMVGDYDDRDIDWLNNDDVIKKSFEALEKSWKEKQKEEQRLQQERANFWKNHQKHYTAPPPKPEPVFNWRTVLGISENEKLTEELIKKKYRKEAMKRHPDHGGTSEKLNELFKARDIAYVFIGKEPP